MVVKFADTNGDHLICCAMQALLISTWREENLEYRQLQMINYNYV